MFAAMVGRRVELSLLGFQVDDVVLLLCPAMRTVSGARGEKKRNIALNMSYSALLHNKYFSHLPSHTLFYPMHA